MATVGRRVHEDRPPVRAAHHVARPQVAVQPGRRLVRTGELDDAADDALDCIGVSDVGNLVETVNYVITVLHS